METILITGAGSGLGKELALKFAQNKKHLLLLGRSQEKLLKVKSEIDQIGGKSDVILADIRSYQDVYEKMNIINEHYQLTMVVNNAGLGYFGPFLKMEEKEIIEMLETNIFGTIFVTKAVLPLLQAHHSGHIVNIISTAGLRGKVNEAVYAATKFAIRGFTESLQKEFKNTSIKFTAVYMGGMDTPFWENSSHIKDPGRLRSPNEIAEIIISQLDQETIVIEKK